MKLRHLKWLLKLVLSDWVNRHIKHTVGLSDLVEKGSRCHFCWRSARKVKFSGKEYQASEPAWYVCYKHLESRP